MSIVPCIVSLRRFSSPEDAGVLCVNAKRIWLALESEGEPVKSDMAYVFVPAYASTFTVKRLLVFASKSTR